MWPRYAHRIAANGTYGICPNASCRHVAFAGYVDGNDRTDGWDRLGPKKCGACGTELTKSDFFQPLNRSGNDRRADPANDPALSVTEVVALAGELIDAEALIPLAVLLKSRGLLKTSDRFTVELENNTRVECPEFQVRRTHRYGRPKPEDDGYLSDNGIIGAGDDLGWINDAHFETPSSWGYRLTEEGRQVLEARHILTQEGKDAASQLLQNRNAEDLMALAVQTHLRNLLEQNVREARSASFSFFFSRSKRTLLSRKAREAKQKQSSFLS